MAVCCRFVEIVRRTNFGEFAVAVDRPIQVPRIRPRRPSPQGRHLRGAGGPSPPKKKEKKKKERKKRKKKKKRKKRRKKKEGNYK